jgi:hypothetical protein
MCHYITAVLPSTADLERVEAIFRRHKRKLEPQPNPSVLEQLHSGERYYLTTSGSCDCGTPLGSAVKAANHPPPDPEAQRLKLQKRGWGEAKIDRWLGQQEERLARLQDQTSLPTPGADEWEALLREVLASGATAYVCLLLHWYSGPITGRIRLLRREKAEIAVVTPDTLACLEEDVLYEFRTVTMESP